MKYILTGSQMSACDRYTSEAIGIPSLVLMERAALSVAQTILDDFPGVRRVAIVSGKGNNGADGVAAGRILTDRGLEVLFFRLPGAVREGSSMQTQLSIIEKYGLPVREYEDGCLIKAAPDLIVDAMFGTGLSRNLAGSAAQAVKEINYLHDMGKCRTVAVDIPSGISSDDGSVLGEAVTCDTTVTFAYYKRGHFLYPGAGSCGKVKLCDIGITDRSFQNGTVPDLHIFDTETADSVLGERRPDGHKGTFGKILIVAGSRNVCGAAMMSAEACFSSGAGMVKIFTREENRVIIQEMIPEAMLTTYSETDTDVEIEKKLADDLAWADICAAGPGIGRTRQAQLLIRTILSCCETEAAEDSKPNGIVMDADALRIIASDSELFSMLSERDPSVKAVLTPHIGEFADLIHVSVGEAQTGRLQRLRKLAGELHCTVIGKDARTIVASDAHADSYLNVSGNSGMATAGSGDVLTGITAAFLALTDDYTAGCLAAWVHGRAGDRAAKEYGTRSMTARSILEFLPEVLNQ